MYCSWDTYYRTVHRICPDSRQCNRTSGWRPGTDHLVYTWICQPHTHSLLKHKYFVDKLYGSLAQTHAKSILIRLLCLGVSCSRGQTPLIYDISVSLVDKAYYYQILYRVTISKIIIPTIIGWASILLLRDNEQNFLVGEIAETISIWLLFHIIKDRYI